VFQLPPGAEVNTTYNLKASNAEAHKFYRANYRMRDGSHHLIMRFGAENLPDGWSEQSLAEFSITDLVGNPSIQGSQRSSDDRPSGMLDIPPENRGLASDLAPRQQVSMNLHHMNRFDQPILREAWVNLWYMPAEEVKSTVFGMFLRGDPQDVMIPPGEHRILHYATSITDALRVVALWGHRHVSTDRFSAWLERSSGETVKLYESFDYFDQPIYQYDSVSQNPPPDVEQHVDGGHSGLVEMKPGDRLHFLCDVTNRQDVTLRFANELFTGEMCILWGSRVGSGNFNTPERARDTSSN
jgi:hypothetical protein